MKTIIRIFLAFALLFPLQSIAVNYNGLDQALLWFRVPDSGGFSEGKTALEALAGSSRGDECALSYTNGYPNGNNTWNGEYLHLGCSYDGGSTTRNISYEPLYCEQWGAGRTKDPDNWACMNLPTCNTNETWSHTTLNCVPDALPDPCPIEGEELYVLPDGTEQCNLECDTSTEWYRVFDNSCQPYDTCTAETPPPYSQDLWSSQDVFSCDPFTNCKGKSAWTDGNHTEIIDYRIGGSCGAGQDNDTSEQTDDSTQPDSPDDPTNPADNNEPYDPSTTCALDSNCTENYDGSTTTNNEDGTYTHEDQNGNTQTSSDPQRPYVNPETGGFEPHGENGGSGLTDEHSDPSTKHELGYDTCELLPDSCVTNPDGTTSIDCTSMPNIAYDPRVYTPNPNDPCSSRYYPSTYGNEDGEANYEPTSWDNGDGTTTTQDTEGNRTTTDNTSGEEVSGSAHNDENRPCPEGTICDTKMGGSGLDICEAPPICKEEDNYQCVTLRIQWEDHCRLNIPPSFEGQMGLSAPLGENDGNYVSTGAGAGSVVNVANDMDESGWGLSRTCPAPPSFTFRGDTFTLDNSHFCTFLEIAGNVLVLFALLAAGRLIVR